MDPLGMLGLASGVAVLGLACLYLDRSIRSGTLDRNRAIGLRTRATLASDEAWHAGHRAALPIVQSGTVVGLGVGFLSFAIGIGALVAARPLSVGFLLLPGIGFVALVILLLIATERASSAARKH